MISNVTARACQQKRSCHCCDNSVSHLTISEMYIRRFKTLEEIARQMLQVSLNQPPAMTRIRDSATLRRVEVGLEQRGSLARLRDTHLFPTASTSSRAHYTQHALSSMGCSKYSSLTCTGTAPGHWAGTQGPKPLGKNALKQRNSDVKTLAEISSCLFVHDGVHTTNADIG